MGNSSKFQAKGKGSIKLEHGKFKDVLYVPSLAANMLFVYQMTHISSPKQVIFGPNSVDITYISIRNIIAKGATNHASRHMSSHTSFHFQNQCTLSCHLKVEVKFFYLLLLQFPLVL